MEKLELLLNKYIKEENNLEDFDDDDDDILTDEDCKDTKAFEEFFGELDESRKSQIVKILIGHGVLKKSEDGKLVKGDNYRKYRGTLKKAGIDHKKVINPHKKIKK